MNRVILGDVVERVKDKVDKDNTDLEYYIGGEHFDYGEVIIHRKDLIRGSTVGPAFHMRFMPGDVLIMSRNPHLRKAGMVNFEGICSDVSYVCRTKDESILIQDFLPFIFQTDSFWTFAEANKKGSTNFFLNWSDFARYEFNLPSMDEQRKLARVLWAANNTIEAYKKLIAATDELVKSQFIEMFGDPIKNEKGWPVCRLCDVAEIRIGPFGTLLHKEDYIENGHPLVNPSHIIDGKIVVDPKLTITDSKYKELSAYHLRVGDIVLGRRGEMGRCAVVHDDGLLCGTGSMIIRPNSSMKAYFLQNIIASPAYREIIENKAVGVTMMNINVPIVSELTMPLLPMELQERYITFLTQTDKSKFELERALTAAKAMMKRIVEEKLG